MVLQKQKIKIPLTAGIDDKVSELVKGPETLVKLENADLKISGEITKRSGFETLIGTGSFIDIKKIHSKGDELLVIDDSDLYTFQDKSGFTPRNAGEIKNTLLPVELLNLSNSSPMYWFNYHIEGDILYYAYMNFDNAQATGVIVYGIYDTDSESYVVRDRLITGENYRAIRCIYALDRFWIAAIINNSGGPSDEVELTLIASNGNLSTGPTISEEPETGEESEDYTLVSAGSHVYLIFRDSSGNMIIKKLTTSSVVSTITNSGETMSNVDAIYRADTGDIYIYFMRFNSNFRLRRTVIDVGTFTVSSNTEMESLTSISKPYNFMVIAGGSSNDEHYIYFDRVTSQTGSYPDEIPGYTGIMAAKDDTGGSYRSATPFLGSSFRLAGRGYYSQGKNYIPAMVNDPGQADSGIALVSHDTGYSIGVFSESELEAFYYQDIAGNHSGFSEYHYLFPADGPNDMGFILRSEIDHFSGTGTGRKAVFRNFARIVTFESKQDTPGIVNYDRYAFITGNFLHMYDGVDLVEHNFLHSPFIEFVSTSTTSGFFSDNSVVQVRCVFQWNDAFGRLHRSAPSSPKVITFGASANTNRALLGISSPVATLRQVSSVEILLYRTEENGTVLYLADSFQSNASNLISYNLTGVDESDIISNEILYTESGEDGNNGVGPCGVIDVFDNRIAVTDLENKNRVLYSKPDRIEFYKLKPAINLPEESDTITAMRELDGRLVVFGAEDKSIVGGTGADITAAGNYQTPRKLPSEHGALSQVQTLVSSQGIFFKSNEGIFLLDRGLNTRYIGSKVESFNASTITSITSVEKWNEIRFTLLDSDDGDYLTLVYNYILNMWSVNRHTRQYVASENFSGQYCVARNDRIYREDEDIFHDSNDNYNLLFKTAWIQLADITGFQRIWRFVIQGRYIDNHTLSVKVFYDYETASSETFSTSVTSGNYEYEYIPARMRCKSIQLEIEITGNNQNATINAVEFIAGVKGLKNRIPVTRRFS